MIAKWKHLTDLLFAAKLEYAFREHHHVVGHRICPCKQEVPVKVLRLLMRVVRQHVSELLICHDNPEAVPPLLELFQSGHIIVVKCGDNLGVLLHKSLNQGKLLSLLLRVDYVVRFFLVEGAPCSLVY